MAELHDTTHVRLGVPVQIAYAVEDVEKAAESWASGFGAGPFFVRHHPAFDATHDGGPAVFNHSSAYGQWGDVQVELVQFGECTPDSLHRTVAGRTGLQGCVYKWGGSLSAR